MLKIVISVLVCILLGIGIVKAVFIKMTEQKTLRDEFAMAAMREILAHNDTRHITAFSTESFEEVAVGAYQMADAMMAARQQEASHE